MTTSATWDDFFAFNQQTKEVESAQEELYRFLKSNNCGITTLNDYPAIKKLFIKYNTALPSSASVKRMFSVDGSIITPQRGHLLDDIIEYQILLKINKNVKFGKIAFGFDFPFNIVIYNHCKKVTEK